MRSILIENVDLMSKPEEIRLKDYLKRILRVEFKEIGKKHHECECCRKIIKKSSRWCNYCIENVTA